MRKLLSILVPVVGVIAVGTALFATRLPPSPFDDAPAAVAFTADLIQQGEYVARTADCVACHSVPGKSPFTGGLEMATPLGSIFATNITPDPETGIGRYSLAEFDRAVRHGVARDDHRLYPAMPYPSYAKLTDQDVRALYAFFLKGIQPVRQENRKSGIPWPLSLRWPLAVWGAVFTDADAHKADPTKDALWNRGAYLVEGPGHCGACHTPRGIAFNEKALDHHDPLFLAGAPLDGWYAPSLRGDVDIGLGRWTEEEIHQFLKTGRNRHAVVFGSMAEAFNNSMQFMTDDDLMAIAHYLKSLPGRSDGAEVSSRAPSDVMVVASRVPISGARTFRERCAFCHGADGQGQAPWIPPLAGAASLMSWEDASSINVTLNGSARVVANGIPDAYRMPPFREHLSNQEMAAVLSFIRAAWGNHGGGVTPDAVAMLRARTNPASSDVIILKMR